MFDGFLRFRESAILFIKVSGVSYRARSDKTPERHQKLGIDLLDALHQLVIRGHAILKLFDLTLQFLIGWIKQAHLISSFVVIESWILSPAILSVSSHGSVQALRVATNWERMSSTASMP